MRYVREVVQMGGYPLCISLMHVHTFFAYVFFLLLYFFIFDDILLSEEEEEGKGQKRINRRSKVPVEPVVVLDLRYLEASAAVAGIPIVFLEVR